MELIRTMKNSLILQWDYIVHKHVRKHHHHYATNRVRNLKAFFLLLPLMPSIPVRKVTNLYPTLIYPPLDEFERHAQSLVKSFLKV